MVIVGLFFSLLQTIFVSYICFSLYTTQNLHLKLPIIHRMKWGEGKSLSHVWLFVTPCAVACQAAQSMGFSRQEYWSGLPFPSPGDLPDPGIEPGSPMLQADSLLSETPGNPIWKYWPFTEYRSIRMLYLWFLNFSIYGKDEECCIKCL